MWTQIKQYMCFKQKAVIYIPNGKPLEFVDTVKFQGSKISSTESDNQHIPRDMLLKGYR